MSAIPPQVPAAPAPEKYLIAFVIQGDDVFKITADNIVHTTNTANGPAFDAIAKLKAAAALLELTNRHKERPDELRQMARELAGEGMRLMARASSAIQQAVPAEPSTPESVSAPVAAQSAAPSSAEVEAVSAAPSQAITPQTIAPETVAPQAVPVQAERLPDPIGPAPVPKPEQRSADSELPGNSPTNSKIALISG